MQLLHLCPDCLIPCHLACFLLCCAFPCPMQSGCYWPSFQMLWTVASKMSLELHDWEHSIGGKAVAGYLMMSLVRMYGHLGLGWHKGHSSPAHHEATRFQMVLRWWWFSFHIIMMLRHVGVQNKARSGIVSAARCLE